jgi:cytochrome c biogenesis protein CcmG/thiol:disulfide interchange protein DsbE
MRRVLAGLWAVMALAQAALAAPELIPESEMELVLVGRTAPDFEAQQADGSPFRLSETRGKPVLLTFWASWCGPCRAELPDLSEYQKAHPELVVYAVNVDRERQRADGFLRQVRFELPIVWDNKAEAMGQYDVLSMPTMFLLDANGTVKWKKVGYAREKGFEELDAALEAL